MFPILLAASLLSVLLLALAAGPAAAAAVRRLKRSHARRAGLWERIYGLDWGPVRTNNYGYAPAETAGLERHQLQMYREHLKALRASGRLKPRTDLLEVSCGRGGGLAHLVAIWPGEVAAVGLDLSANAVAACCDAHRDLDGLRFIQGSALALPFPDASFDVLLNVEASNDYGDYAGFYTEVARVLRPGGVFLYCDSRRADAVEATQAAMTRAGLEGAFHDITANVLEACRQDSYRRAQMIQARVPWLYRALFDSELRNYAGVEGSRKFEAFASRRKLYVMACATKAEVAAPATPRLKTALHG